MINDNLDNSKLYYFNDAWNNYETEIIIPSEKVNQIEGSDNKQNDKEVMQC